MNNLSIRKMNELSKKKKKGFTLVELIIVIAIIAVLAAIAIPKFGQISRNANIKADIATAKNLHGIAAQLAADGDPSTGDVTAKVIAKVDGGATALGKTKLDKKDFVVNIDPTSKDITVTNGTDQIYPAGTNDYKTAS